MRTDWATLGTVPQTAGPYAGRQCATDPATVSARLTGTVFLTVTGETGVETASRYRSIGRR